MNKIILFLLIIFISSKSYAQDKPWASLLSKDFKIQLNIKNQPINNIAKWYSDKSGIVVVPNDNLKGNFTLSSPSRLSISESFELLESFLNLHKYMLVRENKFLVIKPFYKSPNKIYKPIGPENYQEPELVIYSLKYNSAANIAKILNEIFGQNNDSVRRN
jgi:type II secretory pathway component GspD/PulD (secretin)